MHAKLFVYLKILLWLKRHSSHKHLSAFFLCTACNSFYKRIIATAMHNAASTATGIPQERANPIFFFNSSLA